TVPSVDSNTALDELKVNGITISAGDIVEKPFGTDAVSVTATAVSTRATVTVSGEDVLVPGSNTVTVTITAESGATATYTFTVKVAKSNNIGLTSVLVDNQEVLNSFSYTTGYGATSVAVSVVTADPSATYTVSGSTGLKTGANTVTVTVTAADGTTKDDYVIIVTVPVASTNTSLSSVTIAGYEVNPGGGYLTEALPNGTSSVEVVAVAADNKSTVVVSGDTGLATGLNTVRVTVTAESGASTTYEFSVAVAPSSNKEVSSILVDNNEVSVTKALTVGIGVTSVTVTAVVVDPEASYSVSGNTDLEAGANDVVVTVVAGDGSSKQYVIVVTVPSADTNNALDTLVVDNATINAGDIVEKPFGTESVNVFATAVSQKATVVVSGADILVPGNNTVTVTITAESGATATYTFTVKVAKSSDKSLGSIKVNGKSVNVEDTIIVSGDTTSVTVIALANDPEATVSVSGADALSLGDNTVTVTITAADGSSADYVFTVRVPSPSNNANLSFFTVNGVDAIENSVIEVVSDVTEAVIILQTESSNASYEITSGTALAIGNNEIVVVVTSQDQSTSRTYTVTVKRAAPLSSDTTLDSITVNNTAISAGGVFEVANGTGSVEVVATPNDDKATVLVTGATGLKTGDNLVSILVTAENGATAEYTITVKVALSGDNSLASISVNGSSVSLDDLNVTVASGTSSVVVSATPSDVEASYTVSGADALEYGANEVTITVTAANGDQRTYTLNVTRTPLSGNNNIGSITVNGTTVAVDGTFEVDPGTQSVEVVATAEDTDASVAISDSNALVAGNNVITITVTAANGTEATYEINVFVKSLSNDATLKTFTIDGNAVEDGGEVTLDGTKNFVAVVAQANDAGAVVTIEGSTNLAFGSNDVVVTVTAEDGTVAIYTVTVILPN
ncbi:MAG: hypothetical protein EBU12_07945, partial [Microbacteriaceae bacterium]|nr:hypothetical protein [Microbacteriaceae bacterium]